MVRVRPVLVTPLLTVALLLPTAPVHAAGRQVTFPDLDGVVLRHGDLVGAVVTHSTVETGRGETYTQVTTDHYDTRGRLVLSSGVGTDPEGAVVTRSESTSDYDAQGRLVHESVVDDWDGDGPGAPLTRATVTTFDERGYVVEKEVTVDEESDGVPEQRTVYSFGNDRKGRVVATTTKDDPDNDGVVDTVNRGETVYDAKGNVLGSSWTASTPQGGSLGSGELVNTYGAHEQLTSTTSSSYGPDGSLVERTATETAYDARGNAVELTTTYDMDGVPGTDWRTVNTLTYDGHGRLLTSSHSGYGPDATVPSVVGEVRYAYDAQGHPVLTETLGDQDGDGVVEPLGRLETTYDHAGRPVLMEGTFDGGSTRTAFGYDNRGRAASRVTTFYDASDALTSRSAVGYAYPSRTDYVVTTEIDQDGDGVTDATMVETRRVA